MKAYAKGANVLGHGHGGGGHHHGGGGGGFRRGGGFWGGWGGDYDDVDFIPYYVPVVNLVNDDEEMVERVDGEDEEPAKRQGTAREFGLLDSAFAVIVGAHLSASQPLEDYARQLSGQILNQTVPAMTASTLQKQLEALALEVKKITNRNPLDEVYSGPKFPQSQNDMFSGRLLDTPAHAMQEAAPEVAKKFAEAGKSISDTMTIIKWVAIGLGAVAVLGIGASLYSKSRVSRILGSR